MYVALIWLHSYTRWIVLIAAVWALYQAYTGLAGRHGWGINDRRANSFFIGATSAQFVLGLLLYVWPGGTTLASLSNMASTMSESRLRFFVAEHSVGMLLAVALVHIGGARARRAASDRLKFRQAAIFFSIATVVMLVSIPWWRPLLRGLGI